MSGEFEEALSELTKLDLPVPPMFEAAMGYEGEMSYVAFYWEPAGDELAYFDGLYGADGEFQPWLLWTAHDSVRPALRGCHLGSSEGAAREWLALDRWERIFYVGAREDVHRALRAQPEVAEILEEMSRREREEPGSVRGWLMDAIRRSQQSLSEDPAEIHDRVRERMERVEANTRELSRWLDSHGWEQP